MTDHHLVLVDGRRLAYRELGDPVGSPVIHFHGTGVTCSREVAVLSDQCAEARVRVIALNRPGYGDSGPSFGHSLTEAARDASALADHLGLDHYATTGWSGGGPHAGALAACDPDRVTAVGLLASIADGNGERNDEDRRISQAARTATDFGAFAQDYVDEGLAVDELPPADKALFEQPEVLANIMACVEEAVLQGTLGAAGDQWAFFRGWDLDWSDIAAPVLAWHGTADTIVAPEHLDLIAAARPATTVSRCPDEGHLSLLMRYPEFVSVVASAT
jgi:pimeloyl-ACP methyl ester carboxylesterase